MKKKPLAYENLTPFLFLFEMKARFNISFYVFHRHFYLDPIPFTPSRKKKGRGKTRNTYKKSGTRENLSIPFLCDLFILNICIHFHLLFRFYLIFRSIQNMCIYRFRAFVCLSFGGGGSGSGSSKTR